MVQTGDLMVADVLYNLSPLVSQVPINQLISQLIPPPPLLLMSHSENNNTAASTSYGPSIYNQSRAANRAHQHAICTRLSSPFDFNESSHTLARNNIDNGYLLKEEIYRRTSAVGPLEDFEDLHCQDFTHATARVGRRQLRRLEVDPYSYALVRRGLNGVRDKGEDNDPSLVVGMQYSAAIGAMVLDKMSKSEDVLE
jgi:hypothetical protein